MRSRERKGQTIEAFAIAEARIPVTGLQPPVHDTKRGEVIKEGNLTNRLPELNDAIDKRPWFRQLLKDVRAGKKSAVVTTALGGIVITAAIGAGFEFGIRHGQDLREFSKLLRKRGSRQTEGFTKT